MNYELKAAFHTLGCKVNSYETQAIKEQFLALGFEEAGFDEPADVYVINTCSVTQVAERKSRQMISRARKLSSNAVIAATGCYAQEDAKGLIEGGNVDLVIGNNEKSRLAEIVCKKLEENRKNATANEKNAVKLKKNNKNTSMEVCNQRLAWYQASVEISDPGANTETGIGLDGKGCVCTEKALQSFDTSDPDEIKNGINGRNIFVADLMKCSDYEEQKISSAGDHVRAYIKIQDGCNRFCSYCVIPYLRGRSRSRKAADIITEAKALAANGYKEVVLTGIDISDLEEEGYKKGSESLLHLIKEVSEISGIERIRSGSLECGVITEDFLKGINKIAAFCPQFHLSLQSGSESVLKRMNRKYTPDEYYEKVCLIRKYFPSAAITTDIIVGFPGETDEEFEETCEFVKKAAFSRVHVFKYSKRKGTRAAVLEGQIDGNIKNVRSQKLMEITDVLQREYEAGLIGEKVSVLFEEKTEDGSYTGYTPEYVKIAAKSGSDLTGRIQEVVPQGLEETKEGRILTADICP